MVELGSIPYRDRITSGNFHVEIPDPSSMLDTINACTSTTELIHPIYLPEEMSLVDNSRMYLERLDESSVVVTATITYAPRYRNCKTDQAKYLFEQLTKRISLTPESYLENGRITTSLYENSTTSLHVTTEENGLYCLHFSSLLETGQPDRTIYSQLCKNLQLFGTLHAVLSPNGPPVTRELLAESEFHHSNEEYRLWQQLLAGEDELAALDSPTIPTLDHEDINIRSIIDMHGPHSDDFITESLRAIIARKRREHRESGTLRPITHLDLYQEFTYLQRQPPRHRLPDENNHRD